MLQLFRRPAAYLVGLVVVAAIVAALKAPGWFATPPPPRPSPQALLDHKPRKDLDTSGFTVITGSLEPWNPDASREEMAEFWRARGYRGMRQMDQLLARPGLAD